MSRELRENLQVQIGNYQLLSYVGAGVFGKVYRARRVGDLGDQQGRWAIKFSWGSSEYGLEDYLSNQPGGQDAFDQEKRNPSRGPYEKKFDDEQGIYEYFQTALDPTLLASVPAIPADKVDVHKGIRYLVTEFVDLYRVQSYTDKGQFPAEAVALEITRRHLRLVGALHRYPTGPRFLSDCQYENYRIDWDTTNAANPSQLVWKMLDWNGTQPFAGSEFKHPIGYDLWNAMAFLYQMLTGIALSPKRTYTYYHLERMSDGKWNAISHNTRYWLSTILSCPIGQYPYPVNAEQLATALSGELVPATMQSFDASLPAQLLDLMQSDQFGMLASEVEKSGLLAVDEASLSLDSLRWRRLVEAILKGVRESSPFVIKADSALLGEYLNRVAGKDTDWPSVPSGVQVMTDLAADLANERIVRQGWFNEFSGTSLERLFGLGIESEAANEATLADAQQRLSTVNDYLGKISYHRHLLYDLVKEKPLGDEDLLLAARQEFNAFSQRLVAHLGNFAALENVKNEYRALSNAAGAERLIEGVLGLIRKYRSPVFDDLHANECLLILKDIQRPEQRQRFVQAVFPELKSTIVNRALRSLKGTDVATRLLLARDLGEVKAVANDLKLDNVVKALEKAEQEQAELLSYGVYLAEAAEILEKAQYQSFYIDQELARVGKMARQQGVQMRNEFRQFTATIDEKLNEQAVSQSDYNQRVYSLQQKQGEIDVTLSENKTAIEALKSARGSKSGGALTVLALLVGLAALVAAVLLGGGFIDLQGDDSASSADLDAVNTTVAQQADIIETQAAVIAALPASAGAEDPTGANTPDPSVTNAATDPNAQPTDIPTVSTDSVTVDNPTPTITATVDTTSTGQGDTTSPTDAATPSITPTDEPTVVAQAASITFNDNGLNTVEITLAIGATVDPILLTAVDAMGGSPTPDVASSDDLVATGVIVNGALTIVPVAAGQATLSLSINEEILATVTVTVTAANQPPTIAFGPGGDDFCPMQDDTCMINVDEETKIDFTIEDDNSNQLTIKIVRSDVEDPLFTIPNAPLGSTGLEFAVSPNQDLTIYATKAGSVSVTITAIDGNRVESAPLNFTVVIPSRMPVLSRIVDNQPQPLDLTNAIPIGIYSGQTLEIPYVLEDPDGDAVTLSAISSNEALLTIAVDTNVTPSVLRLQAVNSIAAEQSVDVALSAGDATTGQLSGTLSVTVKQNTPPTITINDTDTVIADSLLPPSDENRVSLDIGAEKVLTYITADTETPNGVRVELINGAGEPVAALGEGVNAALDTAANSLTITATTTNVAIITVRATDMYGETATVSFTVSVIVPPPTFAVNLNDYIDLLTYTPIVVDALTNVTLYTNVGDATGTLLPQADVTGITVIGRAFSGPPGDTVLWYRVVVTSTTGQEQTGWMRIDRQTDTPPTYELDTINSLVVRGLPWGASVASGTIVFDLNGNQSTTGSTEVVLVIARLTSTDADPVSWYVVQTAVDQPYSPNNLRLVQASDTTLSFDSNIATAIADFVPVFVTLDPTTQIYSYPAIPQDENNAELPGTPIVMAAARLVMTLDGNDWYQGVAQVTEDDEIQSRVVWIPATSITTDLTNTALFTPQAIGGAVNDIRTQPILALPCRIGRDGENLRTYSALLEASPTLFYFSITNANIETPTFYLIESEQAVGWVNLAIATETFDVEDATPNTLPEFGTLSPYAVYALFPSGIRPVKVNNASSTGCNTPAPSTQPATTPDPAAISPTSTPG